MGQDPIGAGAKASVIAVAAFAGEKLAGTPGAIFAGSIADSALTWFGNVVERNDAALDVARLSTLEDGFRKLSERLEKVERETASDKADPLSREQAFTTFGQDLAKATSLAKREALVNAAAAQFDSRKGDEGLRAHWYREVAALSDANVVLIRLLDRYQHLTIVLAPLVSVTAGVIQPGETATLNLSESDAVALFWAGRVDSGLDALFEQSTPSGVPGTRFKLTQHGRVLADFIRD